MPPCEQQRELELKALKKKKEQRKKSREVIRDQAKKMGWRLTEVKPGKFVAIKPYSNDFIEIEILESGIIKTTTDKISMANHVNAEQFLLNIARDLGGKWNIRPRYGKGAAHTHQHLHV